MSALRRIVVAAAAALGMLMLAGSAQAALTAPRDVTAESLEADQVVLRWQPGAEPTPRERYFIYRDGQQVGATDLTTFTDEWLLGGHLYEYVVRAVNGAGEVAEAQPVRIATLEPDQYETLPYLQRLTSTSVSVMWQTFEPAATGLEYGPVGGATKQAARDPVRTTKHLVRLTGLLPGLTYSYTWLSGGATGTQSFKTPPASPGRFTFDAIGDFGTPSAPSVANLRRIATGNSDFAITVGDNAYPNATASQYVGYVINPLRSFLTQRPFWLAVGNHDYMGIANFKRFFDFPGEHLYYRFRYGRALFVFLDSNRFGPQQAGWARSALTGSRASCKIVVFHHPIWSSGQGKGNATRRARRRAYEPLLQRGGADLVLNGHVHNYERTRPLWSGRVDRRRGITYVVTGGGGAELGGFKTLRKPRWSAVRGAYFQRLRVSVRGDRIRGTSIDVLGRVRDRFSHRCR